MIIGGGFTGLWTAYYLADRDPALRIAVLERDVCGFGASGRNGGWCEGELAGGVDAYAKRSSLPEALRLMRAMQATVDEVGRVATAEGIDCGFAKGRIDLPGSQRTAGEASARGRGARTRQWA